MFNANTSDIKEGRKIPDYARRFIQKRLVTQYFTSQIFVLSIKMFNVKNRICIQLLECVYFLYLYRVLLQLINIYMNTTVVADESLGNNCIKSRSINRWIK